MMTIVHSLSIEIVIPTVQTHQTTSFLIAYNVTFIVFGTSTTGSYHDLSLISFHTLTASPLPFCHKFQFPMRLLVGYCGHGHNSGVFGDLCLPKSCNPFWLVHSFSLPCFSFSFFLPSGDDGKKKGDALITGILFVPNRLLQYLQTLLALWEVVLSRVHVQIHVLVGGNL